MHVRITEVESNAEHELSLQLKPDNTRAYKLNSKNKTAKEVKVPLHYLCSPSPYDACPPLVLVPCHCCMRAPL